MSEPISRRTMIKTVGLGAAALAMSGDPSAMAAPAGVAPAEVPYELPPLPYPYNALEPAIAEEILRVHHDKHHAGYVNGLNATLEKLKEARASQDASNVTALCRDLAFHGSGHVLHTLYWESMTPGGSSPPDGSLGDALERSFSSFSAFRDQFLAATKKVEASGWGLLAYEPLGRRLLILQAEKHQNLTIWGVQPLLICDVWEHAYYLQYKNERGGYVDSFFNIINWPAVERRYASAVAGSLTALH